MHPVLMNTLKYIITCQKIEVSEIAYGLAACELNALFNHLLRIVQSRIKISFEFISINQSIIFILQVRMPSVTEYEPNYTQQIELWFSSMKVNTFFNIFAAADCFTTVHSFWDFLFNLMQMIKTLTFHCE